MFDIFLVIGKQQCRLFSLHLGQFHLNAFMSWMEAFQVQPVLSGTVENLGHRQVVLVGGLL